MTQEQYKQYILIRKAKLMTDGNTLQADIAFVTDNFGTLVIKGFRVAPSQKFDGLWVQPPKSRNKFGKYIYTPMLIFTFLFFTVCFLLQLKK